MNANTSLLRPLWEPTIRYHSSDTARSSSWFSRPPNLGPRLGSQIGEVVSPYPRIVPILVMDSRALRYEREPRQIKLIVRNTPLLTPLGHPRTIHLWLTPASTSSDPPELVHFWVSDSAGVSIWVPNGSILGPKMECFRGPRFRGLPPRPPAGGGAWFGALAAPWIALRAALSLGALH